MAELYGISGGLQVFYGAMKNEYEMVYDDTEEARGLVVFRYALEMV